ncbi:hypothetical protein [Kribbella speibonae]|uniref:Uncharacterized protein n=1 Tax=Kribbella speibonae TaxID=1572660 RepID=A0A4R0J485_9ACTN|nr:hypothetical protein [Kribbella speibonae]TCC40290.1 hypothetical protein E0H92_00815 [Kribbella speibonae]
MFALVGVVSLGDEQPEQNYKVWGSLAEKLMQTALIVKPAVAAQKELVGILQQMPLDVQSKWSELIKCRLVQSLTFPCQKCSSPAQVSLALAAAISVQCSTCGGDLEIPEDLLHNSFLDMVRREQASGMAEGTPCATQMDKAFGLLCHAADTILVIDRYAISDAFRLFSNGSNRTGLQRFIRLADRNNVQELRLVTSSGMQVNGSTLGPRDVEARLRSILAATPRKAIQIKLDIVKKRVAMQHMHDRWIGFSWGTGGDVSWTLGKGLAQFNGPRARTECAMARQNDSSASKLATFVAADIEHSATL